ncbi:hypothetical protein B9Z55_007346 [Caenorhabditis nigoni]|nr:hypothetical protein B9Z55_007346 [Caenorhabditis nigoni]
MSDQKFRLRAFLWHEFKEGKTAAEAHRSLPPVFGENALSKSQCRRWFHRFRSGEESLEDDERSGRPEIIDNDALRQAVELDPCLTTRSLSEQFNCSHMTILRHLHALGKSVRCGKWVPHELSEANKKKRVEVANDLLRRSKNRGFFHSILTSDEKWIQYDCSERKHQWLSPGETPKPTPKPDIHGKKVMICVWWNTRGLVYFELLDHGQTVTAQRDKGQLDRVDLALKQQGVDTSTTLLIHDNARPHTAKITQKKTLELGWEVLQHPPYSPDLAPSDYHLFRSMQHHLAEKKFKSDEEVKIWVTNYFESQPAEFFKKGIETLRMRWQMVVDNDGEYLLD